MSVWSASFHIYVLFSLARTIGGGKLILERIFILDFPPKILHKSPANWTFTKENTESIHKAFVTHSYWMKNPFRMCNFHLFTWTQFFSLAFIAAANASAENDGLNGKAEGGERWGSLLPIQKTVCFLWCLPGGMRKFITFIYSFKIAFHFVPLFTPFTIAIHILWCGSLLDDSCTDTSFSQ